MNNKLLLLLLLSCSEIDAHVVSDELVAVWSYETNPKVTYLSDFCAESVTPISAEYQGIKAIKNQQDDSSVRHRFTLGKVIYQSVYEAKIAVAEINNPANRSSKHSKMCDMRQAFNIKHVAYFVHTEVGNSKSQIKVILDKLHHYAQSR